MQSIKSGLIHHYFPVIDEDKTKKFSQLMHEFPSWNEKINLISRKDIAHLEERHILHSLAISKFISFKKDTEILDIGTGGGFPGIPLAIYFPECNFTLVDSIRKKIHAVEEIKKSLGLNNVKTLHLRAEKINKKFDFVVNRAVTAFPILVHWTKSLINKKSFNSIQNGMITLKGGNLENELHNYKKNIKIIPLNNWYVEDWFNEKYIVYYHQ